MRGTASDDLVFEEVFVPEDRVLANRPYGVVDGPLQVISSIAFPIITGAYLGVAEAAYAAAPRPPRARPKRPRAAPARPHAAPAPGRLVGARRGAGDAGRGRPTPERRPTSPS